MAIDFNKGAVTVSVAAGEATPPKVAVMAELPTATPVARPLALMVAVAVLEEDQATVLVMTTVLWSLYVPVATNCKVPPAATLAGEGVTAIDVNVGGGAVPCDPPPPQPAITPINPMTTTANSDLNEDILWNSPLTILRGKPDVLARYPK